MMPRLRATPHDGRLGRREFLALAALSTVPAAMIGRSAQAADAPRGAGRFLFTSRGKTGLATTDGDAVRYLEFDVPGQASWQPGPVFPDGHRVVMLSMEPRRDGPGKPFGEYYTQTPTHVWIYDLESAALEEICHKERMAPFVTPALLLGDDRILVQVVKNQVGQIFSMRLDGTDAREFTKAGEGMPYGLSLSPDGKRVAFHLATSEGYQVWTSDVAGGDRVRIAAEQAHLYFGTAWSPDGKWITYVDCHYQQDPAHDWADVCVDRADGGEHRVVTHGQSMWFGATYGGPKTHGGGSNVPAWTHDGKILFPRRTAGAKVPWEYQPGRVDVDHFNRDFKPELAKGGTEICRLEPRDGMMTWLTQHENTLWDFRCSESPDGRHVVFCRCPTGEGPAIWVMDADGQNQRQITRGIDDAGADHPRWL
jgi:WD40-like Beta Propeller Repeat